MARSSSGIVAGLTAAALAAVGFLAYQASANAPDHLGQAAQPARGRLRAGHAEGTRRQKDPLALPGGLRHRASASCTRSATSRVWLVGADGKATRTFAVHAEHGEPAPGHATRSPRAPSGVTGSDGVPIEHVVRFASVGRRGDRLQRGAWTARCRAPTRRMKTGGVRMTRADGDAMWTFATIGAKVVVVP